MLYPVWDCWIHDSSWLWLCTLTWHNWGWGGRGEISHSNLINYFSVSGDSKQQKKYPPKKVWQQLLGGGEGRPLCDEHHPKIPLFYVAPYVLTSSCVSICCEVTKTKNVCRKCFLVHYLKRFFYMCKYLLCIFFSCNS